MLVEVPGGNWADTLVLQGSQRDGGDSVLCLESLGPLEIKEKPLFAGSNISPGGVSGWVKRLSSGWRKVGNSEVTQETENQCHPEWY